MRTLQRSAQLQQRVMQPPATGSTQGPLTFIRQGPNKHWDHSATAPTAGKVGYLAIVSRDGTR
jgi:hypothetical protein